MPSTCFLFSPEPPYGHCQHCKGRKQINSQHQLMRVYSSSYKCLAIVWSENTACYQRRLFLATNDSALQILLTTSQCPALKYQHTLSTVSLMHSWKLQMHRPLHAAHKFLNRKIRIGRCLKLWIFQILFYFHWISLFTLWILLYKTSLFWWLLCRYQDKIGVFLQ